MKVTKEWLIDVIGRIPDGTELDITGHDYSLFIKYDPSYKEPEYAPYPPESIYPCRVMDKHMWGSKHCRHCDDPWPEPYLSERIRIQGH